MGIMGEGRSARKTYSRESSVSAKKTPTHSLDGEKA